MLPVENIIAVLMITLLQVADLSSSICEKFFELENRRAMFCVYTFHSKLKIFWSLPILTISIIDFGTVQTIIFIVLAIFAIWSFRISKDT